MLRINLSYLAYAFTALGFIVSINGTSSSQAPVLDVENESTGYIGTIGERNVLVDLKPHLQIKNIESINGICSYHVFKPTSEDFPFTIDIKDKLTGEAVIEVVRKETIDEKKTIFLDCHKRKEYDFLIQAHDCSTPSLPSKKIPVKIQVIDHDDYELKFEHEGVHTATLTESNEIYQNFLSVRARDNDCTNDGYACSYQLLTESLIPVEPLFPIKIDNTGVLSTLRSVKRAESFDFIVRAFDCLNNQSHTDAKVLVTVVEPCTPEWTNYHNEIISEAESTKLFPQLDSTECTQANILHKQDSECVIDSVTAKLSLHLDPFIQNNCKKCADAKKLTLFNGGLYTSDDSIEDEYEDELNKILPVKQKSGQEPANFETFSKSSANWKKIDFDGAFGNQFNLSAWIRRPSSADKTLKEQVLCGTDSKSLNRHHFGLYFYRGNLKFLLRREPSEHKELKQDLLNQDSSNIDSNEAFYPSLWEWSVLSDSKWHLYEVRFNYPNASLFIDGVRYAENNTNSDIIDAYELNDAGDTGTITSHIGACFHARTQAMTDHFEGDIGQVVLSKKLANRDCKQECDEFIDAGSVGAQNFLHSVESSALNEVTVTASSLAQVQQIITRINYVNKESKPLPGARSAKLSTSLHCQNGKTLSLHDVEVKVNIKNHLPDYKIVLDGSKELTVFKVDLENGFEPFKDIVIMKIDQPSDEPFSNELSGEDLSDESNMLSKCAIKIMPERNLMAPSLNNEKVMFLQNLLDEYGFRFEETLNSVLISGPSSIKNYENFIRHLTFVVININEVDEASLDLIRNKKFLISCTSLESKVDSNVITVQVNLAKSESVKIQAENIAGPVAHKQLQSFVVSENDDDIVKKNSHLVSQNGPTSPIVFAILVVASCSIGFVLVFGAIKMYTSRTGGRKQVPNEENPQMEWDDSGLNITENPLDTLEINKETGQVVQHNLEYEDEYTSYDEEDDEYNDDDQCSSEEENVKVVDRELEWDDTSLEIKLKDKRLQKQISKSMSNNSTNNFIDPNQFV